MQANRPVHDKLASPAMGRKNIGTGMKNDANIKIDTLSQRTRWGRVLGVVWTAEIEHLSLWGARVAVKTERKRGER